MSPPSTLRPLSLMVEQVRALNLAEVETAAGTDLPNRLPVVMVDVSAPGVVANGAPEWSASFRATLTAVASTRVQALDLAHSLLDGLLASWRAGRRTDHGWVSHLSVVALPYPSTASGAAGLWSFSVVVDVIARH